MRSYKVTVICVMLFVTSVLPNRAFACTCIGKDTQTTESALASSDLVVSGKVISVTDFNYHDTLEWTLKGVIFNVKKADFLVTNYKVFSLAVNHHYKRGRQVADTIQIVTELNSDRCGYEFEIGKSYIVYAWQWKEKTIVEKHTKRRKKRSIASIAIPNKFLTNVCTPTQPVNDKELRKLVALTN